jgi:hypothetical protein
LRNHCMALLSVYVCVCSHQLERERVGGGAKRPNR